MGGPLRSRGFATLDAGQSRRRSGCGDESSERFQAHFAIFARRFLGEKLPKSWRNEFLTWFNDV